MSIPYRFKSELMPNAKFSFLFEGAQKLDPLKEIALLALKSLMEFFNDSPNRKLGRLFQSILHA